MRYPGARAASHTPPSMQTAMDQSLLFCLFPHPSLPVTHSFQAWCLFHAANAEQAAFLPDRPRSSIILSPTPHSTEYIRSFCLIRPNKSLAIPLPVLSSFWLTCNRKVPEACPSAGRTVRFCWFCWVCLLFPGTVIGTGCSCSANMKFHFAQVTSEGSRVVCRLPASHHLLG